MSTAGRPRAIVAIPAKDEAERIPSCLLALARQTALPDGVLLLPNNCADDTAAVAVAIAPHLPFRLHVISHSFPPRTANAGHARRLAMHQAASLTGADGVLLTTDADGEAAPDWIERNLHALANGADLVCGRVRLHAAEAARIPAHLHADDALECELRDLLDRMADRLDPDPADPLPRHTEAAGASLAVSTLAFRRVGGIPALASGEDRAFVQALARIDARIRHDPAALVTVSGRIDGRAPGGMADTIRRRITRQDEFTDETLEPAADACRRFAVRRRLRQAWQARADGPGVRALAADLAISPALLAGALDRTFFGEAWEDVQALSPVLVRRPVRFAELPDQIAVAHRLLAQHAASPVNA
ncbi:MAG: glycosyltransferase [Acetobacteraceae bacterium]